MAIAMTSTMIVNILYPGYSGPTTQTHDYVVCCLNQSPFFCSLTSIKSVPRRDQLPYAEQIGRKTIIILVFYYLLLDVAVIPTLFSLFRYLCTYLRKFLLHAFRRMKYGA